MEKSTPKIAVFPGTFDPLSNGHVDVIDRGRRLFDRLIVAVGHNPGKSSLFTADERVAMIRRVVRSWKNVTVEAFEGLTVDYVRSRRAAAILRGIRDVTDLRYEFQMAMANRAVGGVETVFIMTGENYAFTSSTLIKQIASGGNIDRLHRLLPPSVLARLKTKAHELGDQFLLRHHEDGLKE